jgi:hypothetical protein
MNPALAGVVVPTVALIVLAAVPYIDRSKEGQGTWFGTVNSVRITIWSSVFAAFGTLLLILLDSGKHAQAYEKITGDDWPAYAARPSWLPEVGIITALWDLVFSRNFRAIQTEWTWKTDLGGLVPLLQEDGKGHDGYLNWPQDFTRIPIPLNGTSWPKWGNDHGEPPPDWYQDLPDWFTGLLPYDLNVNFPAILVEIIIPTTLMLGLPLLLIYILWRIGWVNTRRDVLLSIFSGFIVVYWVMTIIGAAFRGAGQDLVWPWDVPRID